MTASSTSTTLTPLLSTAPRAEVDWFFIFKFDPDEEKGNPDPLGPTGIFNAPGIPVPPYGHDAMKFSRRYVVASSADPTLHNGGGDDVLGASLSDPLGATFGQVYLADDPPYFVIWNDDFYGDPLPPASSPWGHSKGMLVWDDSGAGFVLQVSTPSWPGAASKQFPRTTDGNTLGWVHDDDVEASQHFFALKLTKDDVMIVLSALHNSSVRTDPTHPQAVHNGGPAPIQMLVKGLGQQSTDTTVLDETLSSGVRLISKPSALHVPPWQLVSAQLGGVDLRVASWWHSPLIPSTTSEAPTPACWGSPPLSEQPGAVEIATSGTWPISGSTPNLDLRGGQTHNHAKIGVSTSAGTTSTIFGDMNQQGTLGGDGKNCGSSQNGRGGLFFVLEDPKLHSQVSAMLQGGSAPTDLATATAHADQRDIVGSGAGAGTGAAPAPATTADAPAKGGASGGRTSTSPKPSRPARGGRRQKRES